MLTALRRPRTERVRRSAQARVIARLAHSPWVARRFDPRLVWLFGSPRSGSTWLLRLLAEHPAVVPYDEPMIGHYVGPFVADLPRVAGTDVEPDDCTLPRLAGGLPTHFFSRGATEAWSPLLGDLLRGRILAHAGSPALSRRSPAMVVIKEPNGSQGADLIMAALPRARLLFLLRDGRDVVDSALAAHLEGSWAGRQYELMRPVRPAERLDFLVDAARRWLWRTQVVQAAFEAHPGPKLLVRYEVLRREPLAEVRRVLSWLGLPAEELS